MWHQVGPLFFNYHNDVRSNIRKIYIGVHVNYTLFLSDFNENWAILTYFRKTLKCVIPRQSVQGEHSSSMQGYGQTDMKKVIVLVPNLSNVPEIENKLRGRIKWKL